MRTYRYLVRFEIDGDLCEFPMSASGTGEAIQKAKRTFDKVISIAPIRKGVDPYASEYELATLEKRYYGTI